MNILGYTLENEEKIERAKNGTISRGGQLAGGIAQMIREKKLEESTDKSTKEAKEVYQKALLAEYDRLGGLITKSGVKVKTGSFWDIQKKVARETPELVFMSEIEGEVVEVDEEEAIALKMAKEKVNKLRAKKSKKSSNEE